MQEEINALVVALAAPATRTHAALATAHALGCESLALFVRDSALGLLVPAPGMPKTFAGGPLWREFLGTCLEEGRHVAEVDFPAGTLRPALALSCNGTVALLLGGAPRDAAVDSLAAQLPLLGALLQAEQQWVLGQAEMREARLAADRAHALVKALDAARASAAGLNEQLRREHSRKDEFLAMLAHELRNPLSPLVNSLAILGRLKSLEGELPRRQLEMMERQVAQLIRLVDDLLDVSRVNRGQIVLRRELLALSGIIQTAVDSARPAIEVRRHQLHVSMPDQPVFVYGDGARLTQVFSNLLQNAAKYTDPGGLITVGVIPDNARVSVIVKDTGIGIPKHQLPRVFDLFEQLSVALDRSEGGLGIGLTLVRSLTELHGGQVSAHSVGLGQGSTFTVSLPTATASKPLPQTAPDAALVEPRNTRVLVVDDNEDAGDSLAEVLRLLGAEVKVARDGAGAIAVAGEFRPQLVLLDIGLPGMDGYETARRLRALPLGATRLVALTGYGTSRDKRLAGEAGFDDHMVKPASMEDIAAMLSACVPQSLPADS
ncbi:MAG: ATP-binding protein [Ramlibacter sp.]